MDIYPVLDLFMACLDLAHVSFTICVSVRVYRPMYFFAVGALMLSRTRRQAICQIIFGQSMSERVYTKILSENMYINQRYSCSENIKRKMWSHLAIMMNILMGWFCNKKIFS